MLYSQRRDIGGLTNYTSRPNTAVWSNAPLIPPRLSSKQCLFVCRWLDATAVLILLKLEDHLKNLSLSCGPPMKIVPWKIAKIGLVVCFYPCKLKTQPLLADHQADVRGSPVVRRPRLRTASIKSCRPTAHDSDACSSLLDKCPSTVTTFH